MNDVISLAALFGVIGLVLWKLPKVELGHSAAFKRRRFWNWFPLGFTYALLYMGRYNLAANTALFDSLGLIGKKDFGIIDGLASATYGIAFLVNGPLTDRWG